LLSAALGAGKAQLMAATRACLMGRRKGGRRLATSITACMNESMAPDFLEHAAQELYEHLFSPSLIGGWFHFNPHASTAK